MNISKSTAALNYAIILAEMGTPVFPCQANKAPACKGGFKAATTDANELRKIWNSSSVLIGLPTGEKSGFSVLDIDPRHGGDKWLAENEHRLPKTLKQKTLSGGYHFYFNNRSGLRSSAGKIADGVDIRADGGYVICWAAYGLPVLCDALLADFPDWLMDTIKSPKPQIKSLYDCKVAIENSYAHGALLKAARAIASAPNGCRNDTLNRELWSILRFAESGEIGVDEVTATLSLAGLMAGLNPIEITNTLRSVLRSKGFV